MYKVHSTGIFQEFAFTEAIQFMMDSSLQIYLEKHPILYIELVLLNF